LAMPLTSRPKIGVAY